jgi:hypothetical protein
MNTLMLNNLNNQTQFSSLHEALACAENFFDQYGLGQEVR